MLLVERALAETRERAQALILAGDVRVGERVARRPADLVPADAEVTVSAVQPGYVSRGALKLVAALDHWHVDPAGQVVLDVGASTGGFTDVLLRRGALKVYAVDVGYGQLHYRLRGDPRVTVLERTNVRFLGSLPERPRLAVVDVSFISLRLALPPVFALLADGAPVVALVKPQFEAGRAQVRKGGVVRDPAVHRQVLRDLAIWSADQPWHLADVLPSPIRGPAGNVEFLSRWTPDAPPTGEAAIAAAVVAAPSAGPTNAHPE